MQIIWSDERPKDSQMIVDDFNVPAGVYVGTYG